jgi:CarD family transcriptional regulator
MELEVGSAVVYPLHGVGRITASETRSAPDGEQDVLVIELHNDMSLVLPLERARQVLRPPASAGELDDVAQTLQGAGGASDEPWPKRRDAMQEKLREGSPVSLAEVIRDGVRRREALPPARRQAQMSASERGLYTKVRGLLSSEIALVRGIGEEDADAWIDEQLGQPSE